MDTNQFIKLFVPPVYYKLKKRLSLKSQPNYHPLPKNSHNGDKMIIIGNGPSFNKTMELYGNIIRNTPCMMVNFAAQTNLYEIIKPTIYLLVDPAWYAPTKIQEEAVYAALDTIVRNTTWKMTIIMPRIAMNYSIIEQFNNNKNLDVQFFEDKWQIPKGMTKLEAWDANLTSPPGQTVLNTAIWLSIYLGYTETYLVGADTSWHSELCMDQETNELFTIDSHFYRNKDVYGSAYDEKLHRRPVGAKIHEELFSIATALKSYWELREYAEWKGVNIYNASEYSWIDAFERKKLA